MSPILVRWIGLAESFVIIGTVQPAANWSSLRPEPSIQAVTLDGMIGLNKALELKI